MGLIVNQETGVCDYLGLCFHLLDFLSNIRQSLAMSGSPAARTSNSLALQGSSSLKEKSDIASGLLWAVLDDHVLEMECVAKVYYLEYEASNNNWESMN